jgi:hypothetical protein
MKIQKPKNGGRYLFPESGRYGERLELICYSLDIYNDSISNVSLSSSRLKQMKNINNPLLRRIADAIAETGKAAYQEAFASHIGF